MQFCTVAGPEDVPWARSLVAAIRRLHPSCAVTVLVVDEPARPLPDLPGAIVLELGDLGVPDEELHLLTLVHPIPELHGVLRPLLLRHLLDLGPGPVVYLDPQIVLLAPLATLADTASEYGVALVQRSVQSLPQDGLVPGEADLVAAGLVDDAVLAVADVGEARTMLDWWLQRDRLPATEQPATAGSESRRRLDLARSLFAHEVLADPTYNVGRFNLAGRTLSRDSSDRLLVDGEAVTFLNLAGYRVDVPYLLCGTDDELPRHLLSEDPELRAACERQRADVMGRTDPGTSRHDPPFSRRGDVPVDDIVRTLVRREVLRAGPDGTRGVDVVRGQSLDDWLDTPDPATAHSTLGRYLAEILRTRPDLVAAYPEVLRGDYGSFLSWAERHGRREIGVPQTRIDRARGRSGPNQRPLLSRVSGGPRRTTAVDGVEVVGYLTAELGQGESARQFVLSLEAAGVPVSTSTYTRLSSRLGVEWVDREPAPGTRHDVVLLCVSPEALPELVDDLGPAALKGRYRIGLWFWELTDFPDRLLGSLDLVDEIWVASAFNAETLRGVTDKPVVVMPHPAHAPAQSATRLPEVPDDGVFTFLFVFDFFSVLERKNPMRTIEAFGQAFPVPGQARLVIKSINGGRMPAARERLRYLSADRPDIVLVERYLSRAELDGLMHGADCYVSLHRSEGFGQTLAESMAIGKPVIATDYSGNLEFTRPDNSFLVSSTLTQVPPGCAPYLPPAQWGDPDLEGAVAAMRLVVDDPELAAARGSRAAKTISEEFSTAALATAASRRLAVIQRGRADRLATGTTRGDGSSEPVGRARRRLPGLRRPRQDD